jgi:hypothetical protein
MSNKRKFRYWDNKVLFNSLQKAVQIKSKIEEQCYARQVDPSELPMSMIPTQVLYELAACYWATYDKLLEEELISNGYSKLQPIRH